MGGQCVQGHQKALPGLRLPIEGTVEDGGCRLRAPCVLHTAPELPGPSAHPCVRPFGFLSQGQPCLLVLARPLQGLLP